jgi:SAM-dependent methyltransferase
MMNPAEFANLARCEKDFWWHRGMEQILFRVLDPIVEKRKLATAMEAGSGTGHMASRLESYYGWRVFPTDLQREGLVYGINNGCRHGAAQADVAALPFPSGRFDVVASLDVISHFPSGDEQRAMRELVRVLAPGGVMVVRVCALDMLRSRHSMFTDERQRFTRKRLIELVASHGIRVLRCTYANSLLLPIALAKFRIAEPLLRKRPASGIRQIAGWLNQLLYATLRLESVWLGSGRNFLLGQSLILIGERTR